MDKIKSIKYEIMKLQECIDNLKKAHECIKDVDDTDEVYEKIYNISEKINEIKMNKEIEMESMVI